MSVHADRASLGRTGLQVGRLGVGASYGVSPRACHDAFERGVNYFYWGSVRTRGMGAFLREAVRTRRDDLVLVLQTYARRPEHVDRSLRNGLRALGADHADVLLLGWHDEAPAEAILDVAERLRNEGAFRFLAMSSHQRPLIRTLLDDRRLDVFHVRYNAAHRGAEPDVFAHLPDAGGPGVVTYTTTRWGDLLRAKNMPPGHAPPTAADCYRFALSSPHVDVVMCGPRSDAQMQEALAALDAGPLSAEDLDRMREIGDHVHGVRSLMSALT